MEKQLKLKTDRKRKEDVIVKVVMFEEFNSIESSYAMNDKQESAMNISERDIENAFIQQDDAAVERELMEGDEWVNGLPPVGYEFHIDEEAKYDSYTRLFEEKIGWEHEDLIRVVYADDDLDFVVCLNCQHDVFTTAKLDAEFFLTPEQIAAKEREAAIDQMWIDTLVGDCVDIRRGSKAWHHCSRIYDAGYRK